MNVCFISVCQFNEFSGGVDRVCCQLSRELIRRGYRFVYVFSNASVLGHPSDGCEGEGQYQFPFTIWDDRNIAFFSEVIAKHKVDVVIDAAFISRYHDVAYHAKMQTPFKLITTYHGDPLCDIKEIKDKIDCLSLRYNGLELLAKKIYSYLKYPVSYAIRNKSLITRFTKIISESDYYVVLCEEYAKKLRKITNDSYPEHIISISNPIELTSSTNELLFKNNQVLFVGRLNEQKRVDRLLRVWAKVEKKLTDWNLVVVGEGDARDQYEDFARSLQLKNVQYLGKVNSTEEMKRSKIVAMVSSHEGFGMTLVEGMAVGTVPMAFDSYEALQDIVDDGVNGYCIRPWDYEDFARKIVALAKDDDLWRKLSSNAKTAVKKFDVSTIVDKWEKLLNEATI